MEDKNILNDILETVVFIRDNAVTKEEFQGLEGEFQGLKGKVQGLKDDVQDLKTKVIKIEATMVTKEYLDDKLADQTGDITLMMRKEDAKLRALVDLLEKKRVITPQEKDHLFSLQPFPQLA